MAIHYTCRCGAHIRMPRNVAGKKARCNSCGLIFTVPQAAPEPAATPQPPSIPFESAEKPPGRDGSSTPPSRVATKTAQVGDWLGEFARQEAATPAEPTASRASASGASASTMPPDSPVHPSPRAAASDGLFELADEPDNAPAPSLRRPRPVQLDSGTRLTDEARSGVHEPTRPYWTDLAGSFFFFLDGGSAVTFVIIVLIKLWTIPLSYAGPIGFLGTLIITGYLCTFYMSIIKETASGEDELPNVWIDSTDELFWSFVRFAGTWAWVLLPAALFVILEYLYTGSPAAPITRFGVRTSIFDGVSWNIATVLAIVGLLFWPVVILGVSLGGSFHGMWPHTVVMTALVAPLPYLAMCGVLLVAAGITLLPSLDIYTVVATASGGNRSFFWTAALINSGLSTYAMIVAMRAVGLYYRHYKQKFPWVAE